MSKIIIITGANGFVGNELVCFFEKKGFKIKALVRNVNKKNKENISYIKYELGKPIENESEFEHADYLIHCAFSKFNENNNSDTINIKGTKYLIEMAKKYAIKIVFLSSFSAHKGAESHYGKNKLFIESFFNLQKDLILKVGLVLGKGGIFNTISVLIEKTSLIPLAGGGKQPLQTINIMDLCRVIESALAKNLSGIYWIAEPTPISMKNFYLLIAEKKQIKISFIPIPLWMLLLLTKTTELLKLKIAISSENLLGLKNLVSHNTSADMETLEISPMDAKASVFEFSKS